MSQPRKSYAENRKEVYKFWLGFFEKVTLIVVTVAIIPFMVGQLSYVFAVLAILVSFIFVLIIAMAYLSRKIWYLPKDDSKSKSREAKNE